MMGAQNGTAKKLKDMVTSVNGFLSVIHAVAHVEQLCNADAFNTIEYYLEWRNIIQAVYVEYAQSGKKRFSLEEVASMLGDLLLKLGSSHGIRWAAAQANTIRALMTDLPTIAADLEYRVKTALGMEYTLLTPSNNFINKSFYQHFTSDNARTTRWKATVTTFEASGDGVAANDIFLLKYKNKTTLKMPKAELVSKLTNLEDPRLQEDSRWELREKITTYRFVAFTAFMLDIHDQLAILSKSYQSNSLTVFDIPRNLNKTLASLAKLKTTPGSAEVAFLQAVEKDDNADMLRTCQLFDGDEGRKSHKEDRIDVVDALTEHLTTRFKKVLDDPVLQAMGAFDHRRTWPSSKEILADSLNDEIALLYKTYNGFFDSNTETEEMVLEQWREMKEEIRKEPGLNLRNFHDLWPHMLVHYTDEYNLVLRLVAIALLVPTDTSECERVFSLMNDLKTAERSLLKQETLKNLMLWHSLATKVVDGKRTHLDCKEVPVISR